MTVVYLDELFALNLLVNYLLLHAAGRLAGEPLRRGRMLLGAALGACYAAAVCLPGTGWLLVPACKLCAGVLMLLWAYGHSRHLLRVGLVFFLSAAAFGGGVFALGALGGRGLALENGVLSSCTDLRLILLSAAGCSALASLVLRRWACHGPGELREVTLRLGERTALLTALTDTGHSLTDPVTGEEVLVAEGERLTGLFPPGQAPTSADLLDPATALTELGGGEVRLRLLPYRAVGVDCGFLLALRVDEVLVEGESRGSMLVALSPTPVSDGGGCGALIGA